MHLGNSQTDWYLISREQAEAARTQGREPCAPGYALSIMDGGLGVGTQYYCRRVSDGAAAGGASAAVPVTVNVSPRISTQVSPQISPVFQQQFQPQNSPATAGTTQTAPTTQGDQTSAPQSSVPAGMSASDVERLLQRQAAEYAALLDRAMATQSTQAAPLPTMAPVNLDQSSPVPNAPIAPVIPALPGSPSSVPELTNMPTRDNKPFMVAAALGLLGLLAFKRKGKNASVRH